MKIERSGDPAFAQRRVTERGVEYTLPPEMAAAFQRQAERFKQKFGREPGPHDPVFFDPDADVPTPVGPSQSKAEVRKAIIERGLDPAFADAFGELGYIVSDMNRHTFTAHEIDAWDEAVARSRRRSRTGG